MRVARTALNEVAPSTLHRHFEARLQKVRYGSWEESGMAYVLAMRGFEPLHNARRLTHNWNQQDTTDDFYDVDLGIALAKIYRAHPSDALMRLFLTQRGDAHAAETMVFERQEILLRFPRALLRVAAGNTAITNRLASDLTYENSAATPIARRIDATLKTAARRSSKREATAARYLLRRIKHERIGEP